MYQENVCLRSRQGISKTDIIAINGMAKADQEEGNKVINASIGTYLTDEGKVGGISEIKKSLREHVTDSMGYPSVYGNPEYLDDVMNIVFGAERKRIEELYVPFAGATLGGTGAISMAFNLFLDEGEEVILPDVMWTNYKLIAKKAHVGYRTYTSFTSAGELNLKSIEEAIRASFKEHKHVIFVLNDPCQNPTGYSLSPKEYDAIFALFNRLASLGQLTVLFDIAYMAYYKVEGERCMMMDKLSEKVPSFFPVICFSCSKIFGMYGLRLGALITLSENKADEDEIKRAFGAQARGTYSTSVGAVQSAISKVLGNKDKWESIQKEIAGNASVVYQRGQRVTKELDQAHIGYYPYKCGFFITLKVNHAFDVFAKLKENHMYVVPMSENTIRLALSGMTEEDAVTLIREMKDVISKMD